MWKDSAFDELVTALEAVVFLAGKHPVAVRLVIRVELPYSKTRQKWKNARLKKEWNWARLRILQAKN